MVKKRRSFWLMWLAAAVFMALGLTNALADTTQVLPDGSYSVQTSYYTDAAGTKPSNAMSGFWGQSGQLTVKNNQATLTFTQKAMMNLMTSATFDGHNLKKTANGQSGTWSVNLSPQDAVKLETQSIHSGTVVYNVNGSNYNQSFYVKLTSGLPATIDQPGDYQLGVKYDEADGENDSGQPSMIQSGGLWADQLTYHLDSAGSASISLEQPKMMDYMAQLSIDGQKMTKQAADKATSGSWTGTLPLSSVRKLTVGGKLVGNMTYTVPGLFTHNVDVIIVITSKQLVKADPLATTAVVDPDADANTGSASSAPATQPKTDTPATSTPVTQPATGTSADNDTNTTDSKSTGSNSNATQQKNDTSAPAPQSQPASGTPAPASTKTLSVIYNKIGSQGEDLNQPSMIQTDGIWSDQISLKDNGNGTVTVTLTQPKLMNYMTSAAFDGVTLDKHVASATAQSGSWTAVLPKSQVDKYKVGSKIVAKVSYTIPGAFTHNESVLVVIKGIAQGNDDKPAAAGKTSGDQLAPDKAATSDQLAPNVAATSDQPAVKTGSLNTDAAPVSAATLPLAVGNNQKVLPQTGNSGSLFLTILGIMVVALATIIGIFSLRRKNGKEI
ncbi:MAG: LPXTG cell wall anchor domain-containing protein [Liquorilactobacillus ghanensis]|uniref:LPXTG cell wall anchor domain-containing protein n=1 Tax=Liquorilactobacillus ghanensis TaxID=399370 RepID=UPI0039EB58DD